MTPTIVLGTDGKTAIVSGASGGPFIITTPWEIISNADYRGVSAGIEFRTGREHQNVTWRQWLITQIAMSIPSA